MLATFRSLRIRNYRLYASGAFVSNVGTWLQRVAQDWLVLHLSGSGVAVGVTTALQFLPFLLITPIGGLIADRFPKRKVLMCTQVGMAGSAAMLGLLDVTGVVEVWHVYVLAFLFGLASAIDGPAKQSFVVELVGKDDLPNAVGLNSASFNGARMLGPAIAGFLIVVAGTGWAILLNAASYGATLLALSRLRESELHEAAPVERKPGMLRDGLNYVRGRPDLLCVFAVVAFVGCFGLNFQLTSALMAKEVFGKGAGEYGLLGTFLALGSFLGALVAARRTKPRLRLVVVSAVAFAVVQIAGGLMPTYGSFAATLPVLGFASLTMLTAANAIIQLTVRPEMRGRVMSLYMVLQIGTTPIGSPFIGWIGETFGARWTLLCGGAISLVGTVAAAYILNRSAGLIVRAHLRPRPHVHVWRPEPATRQASRINGAGESDSDEQEETSVDEAPEASSGAVGEHQARPSAPASERVVPEPRRSGGSGGGDNAHVSGASSGAAQTAPNAVGANAVGGSAVADETGAVRVAGEAGADDTGRVDDAASAAATVAQPAERAGQPALVTEPTDETGEAQRSTATGSVATLRRGSGRTVTAWTSPASSRCTRSGPDRGRLGARGWNAARAVLRGSAGRR